MAVPNASHKPRTTALQINVSPVQLAPHGSHANTTIEHFACARTRASGIFVISEGWPPFPTMHRDANSTWKTRYRVGVRAAIAFPGFDFGMPDIFRR